MVAWIAFSLILAFAAGNDSQALVSTKSVCEGDVDVFCPSEKSSSSCAQFKCLQNHLDFVTAPCLAYLKEKLRQKESCKNATATFCSDKESKWDIYRCLMANVDQINGTCGDYIREKMAEYGKDVPLNACDNDATTLCSNSTGFSATLICIKQNWKELSKDCRRLLWQLKKNETHGHEKWHGSEAGTKGEGRTRGGPRGAENGEESRTRRHERHEKHERHENERGHERHENERGHERHEKHENESGGHERSQRHSRHEGRSRSQSKGKEMKTKKEERSRESKAKPKEKEQDSKKTESKSKKLEKCLRKLQQSCEKDIPTYCSNVNKTDIREIKTCLMLNFAKLDKNCSECLVNPKFKNEEASSAPKEVLVDPLNSKPVQIQQNEKQNVNEILSDDKK